MNGAYLIAGESRQAPEQFVGIEAATGEQLAGSFAVTTPVDLAEACAAADAAFDGFRELAPARRAAFLEAIAAGLEAIGEGLVQRAVAESGLPQGRISGELGRTCGQLRLFAQVAREGQWARAAVEPAQPERQPLPRPDLRQRMVPLGPVAVFGASNFPLAFSVAGGDTASALAAGCPVVVKAHPAHPGTSVLVGQAIVAAAVETGMPAGVFSLVQGPGNDLGAQLVTDPHIAAVAFTGSRSGGLALLALAQARAVPIPVYAEMSSVNPVVLAPAALAARAEELATAYVGSLTLGAGQFCTNPGLVFAVVGPDLDRFVARAETALREVAAQTMLHAGIAAAYADGSARLLAGEGVTRIAQGKPGLDREGQAGLFVVDSDRFRASRELADEVFGPSSVIVRCRDASDLQACLQGLEGQLTATLQMDAADLDFAVALRPLLERKAGRILVNGWPTGVEVCRTMVHGGPFPATSDPRSTSVGARAIERFLRPICYQAFPQELLPEVLRDGNPLDLPRETWA